MICFGKPLFSCSKARVVPTMREECAKQHVFDEIAFDIDEAAGCDIPCATSGQVVIAKRRKSIRFRG